MTVSGDDSGATPDEQHAELARSIMETMPLRKVAAAISAATEHERCVYVERMSRGWRWSLVHAGGPYPLLRVTARFLRMDYHRLVIPTRALSDGNTIVWKSTNRPSKSQEWALVNFDSPATPREVEAKIHETFDALAAPERA